jgi:hypothetical protein
MIDKNTRLRIFVVWFFHFLWNDKIILSHLGKIIDSILAATDLQKW